MAYMISPEILWRFTVFLQRPAMLRVQPIEVPIRTHDCDYDDFYRRVDFIIKASYSVSTFSNQLRIVFPLLAVHPFRTLLDSKFANSLEFHRLVL